MKTDELVENRGGIYGHPYDDFGKVVAMVKPIQESGINPRLKHALYMVQVKISRLLESPDHRDSIEDICGYMKTYEMVLDVIEKKEKCSVRLDIGEPLDLPT